VSWRQFVCGENRPAWNPISREIETCVVPYAAKLYAYIFVANVLAVVIVVRWVKPVGFMVSMAFGLAFGYLTIVTGRWLFGRKELWKAQPQACDLEKRRSIIAVIDRADLRGSSSDGLA
jgi:hypothetical protein